jgi:O-antigen/teichoic acid export membrane protein
MNREKSLIKNTVVLAIGRFLPTLFSLVTIPIVTACLTKAEYGTYDLVATLIVLLLPIATLQIQSAAFRFLIKSRDDEDRSKAIISNIFFITIIVSVIVLFIFMLVFPDKISTHDKIIIACYFMANIIQATLGQVARGLGRNRDFSAAAILLAGINALLVYILVKVLSMGFSGVFIALAVADTSAAVFLAIRIKLPLYLSKNALSKSVVKEMIGYSWPMVPNNLSNWVLKLSDRLVITSFLGVEANAVYAVANKIPNMLSMAQSVFVMAWHENASISIDDADVGEYYRKMLTGHSPCFSALLRCSSVALLSFSRF